MAPMVISLGHRGRATRVCRPVIGWRRLSGPSATLLMLVSICATHSWCGDVCGQSVSSGAFPSGSQPRGPAALTATLQAAPPREVGSPTPASAGPSGPSVPEPSKATGLASARTPEIERFKVRDGFDNCVVARLHGRYNDKTALLLPDGQLGFWNRLVPTKEPFQPLSADLLAKLLQEGPYAEYSLLKTEHYLIFYQSSLAFAQDSGRLLDDLYKGLIDAFRRNGFPVHDTEFPLVAVIFATERDFRQHKSVDPQVQAYYEFFTNRIFFYQKSDRDQIEPKLATLLKPQTVAHEGAHQILSNIGLQPRPCAWPAWLVEGLAEYCATTVNTKKGIVWRGMAAINSLHMATLRELDDPLSNRVDITKVRPIQVARERAPTQTESLVLKPVLTPPDYAQAWALTHFLAQRRGEDFVKYLKAMSQIPPLGARTPQQNLADFRRFFGEDLTRLDKKLDDYIHKLSQKKGYDLLPYFTVVFVQPMGNGVVRRLATVSQSPQMIQQWVHEETMAAGGEPNWEAVAWPTRARAQLAAEEWMRRDY
jgi:Protein of unknown function (DUF1570)